MKFNVNEFEILDSYSRRGKTVTLKVKLFDTDNEEINGYGLIGIKLNKDKIYESLLSYEYGHVTLSENDIVVLESKIVESTAYKKALESFNKK